MTNHPTTPTQSMHTIRFRKYAGGPLHSIKVRGELQELLQGMRTRYKSIDILRTHSPVGRVVTRGKRAIPQQNTTPQNDQPQQQQYSQQPLPTQNDTAQATPQNDQPLFNIPLFL